MDTVKGGCMSHSQGRQIDLTTEQMADRMAYGQLASLSGKFSVVHQP